MQPWNDERLEGVISALLRTGVLASALVVLAGGVGFLAQHGSEPAGYHVFHPAPAAYRTVHGVLGGAASLDYRAIIQLGLLLLIATPVARVAFSLAAFAMERDRTYVALTLVVLVILVYSLTVPH
jgi:uncharacterized membrane protein